MSDSVANSVLTAETSLLTVLGGNPLLVDELDVQAEEGEPNMVNLWPVEVTATNRGLVRCGNPLRVRVPLESLHAVCQTCPISPLSTSLVALRLQTAAVAQQAGISFIRPALPEKPPERARAKRREDVLNVIKGFLGAADDVAPLAEPPPLGPSEEGVAGGEVAPLPEPEDTPRADPGLPEPEVLASDAAQDAANSDTEEDRELALREEVEHILEAVFAELRPGAADEAQRLVLRNRSRSDAIKGVRTYLRKTLGEPVAPSPSSSPRRRKLKRK